MKYKLSVVGAGMFLLAMLIAGIFGDTRLTDIYFIGFLILINISLTQTIIDTYRGRSANK